MMTSRRKKTLADDAPLTETPSMTDIPTFASTTEMLTVSAQRHFAGFTLDVDFTVPSGLIVLFGPSGSGKSLTLQALAGLCQLDAANIRLGQTCWQNSAARLFLPPQQRHVGYVPQNYALFPHLTVAQNIAFGLPAHNKQAQRRVAELVSLMRLDGLQHARPAQLSGGQQQRVALARALAPFPRLLLLDEPFSSLDAAVREALREEVRNLYEQVRIPIVLVTHDAQEARILADTIVVLQNGRVLQTGPQESVFRSPRTPQVATLVGMRTHWPGDVLALKPLSPIEAELTLSIADFTLTARVPQPTQLSPGQHVTVGIRSDEVRILAERFPSSNNAIPATVTHVQERGSLCAVTLQLTPEVSLAVPLLRWQRRELDIATGQQVALDLPPEAIHVFDA
jgi:molybdate transport system ATP-binding protein